MPPSGRVCFLLGAGASVDFGAPVMRDFLDRAREIAASETSLSEPLEQVEQWRSEAIDRKAMNQSNVSDQLGMIPDADNLEDLLCLAEMDATTFNLDVQPVVDSLRHLTAAVYGRSIRPKVDEMLRRIHFSQEPVLGYEQLVHRVRAINEGALWCDRCSFLTLNYDLALDTALAFTPARGFPYYVGKVAWVPDHAAVFAEEAHLGLLYWLGRATDHQMERFVPRILKLHGSLNWGVCSDPTCDAPVQQFGFFSDAIHQTLPPASCSAEQIIEQSPCQYHPFPPEARPKHRVYLVPPSWKKEEHRYALRRIWTMAQIDLSLANRVVIVGHSLPPTDSYLRHFLALGLTRTPDKRILVVSKAGPGLDRYRKFLSGLLPERGYELHEQSFAESVDRIISFVSEVL